MNDEAFWAVGRAGLEQVARPLVEIYVDCMTGWVELGLCLHQLSPAFPLPPIALRYLCDKVVPGNRVTIMGIYSIKKFGLTSSKGRDRVGVGIRSSYIRVLGIQVDTDGSGELALGPWLRPRCLLNCCWPPPCSRPYTDPHSS